MGCNSGLLVIRLDTDSLKHCKALKGNKRLEKLSERHCNFYISPNIISYQIYNGGLDRLIGARVGVTCGLNLNSRVTIIIPKALDINPLALELDIYSLAHHLCKM